ncbi:MAG TPA: hypothetical protein VEX15_22150 [Nocardioidaceae bacterium]|nr:hypothetical protein [Nocardioidaceae bacterium]
MADLAPSLAERLLPSSNIAARVIAILALACAMSSALAACGDDEAECAGDDSGDVSLGQGVDLRLPSGGSAAMAQADPNADPPWLDLSISPASEADMEAADDLQIDDSFTVAGTTYVVVGICEDSAYLDREDGAA